MSIVFSAVLIVGTIILPMLKLIYPQMKKWRFLFFEVKRWVELLKKGSRHRIMIAQKSGELSEEKRDSIKNLFTELEIN